MTDLRWLVGVGSADVTGEPWGAGMMGYGMRFQRTQGLHLRQRSRAFAVADRASGRRLVLVVADIGMIFANVRAQVLARLDLRPEELLLTATHTHAGPGGFSGYRMYNTTNKGQRPHTLQPLVDGLVGCVQQALADLAPGRLVLSRGELHDASVNRSPEAFARNPTADRAHFPGGIDPATTLLRLEREGRTIGVVNWFATHGTSLTNRNRLISGDNKGYAAHAWEAQQPVVAAFAQTNAGDLSPNVPDATKGPTDDDVENTRIVGGRQLAAAQALAQEDGHELTGGLDARLSYVDLAGLRVAPEFSPDGKPHRTGRAVLGAAFAAGTKEGPGLPSLHEGVDGNPLVSACSAVLGRVRPDVRDAHAPKAMLLPVGALGWAADRVPVQLVRLGPLVLVGLAQEVTVVAGLRIRRAVADVLDMPLEDVLLQGYANDYAGYVTTPEEYDAQRYEGGHTMFGRWELPAYLQEVTRVARALRDGTPAATAGPPRLRPQKPAPADDPDAGARVAGFIRQPADAAPGGRVRAVLAGDDPRGPARAAYLQVEREEAQGWAVVARDGDWATTLRWQRDDQQGWTTEVTWQVPVQASGPHRLTWLPASGEPLRSAVFAVR
jgi:neutral ceramidase